MRRVLAFVLVGASIAAGCTSSNLPVTELRSGRALEAVKKEVDAKPISETRFTLGPRAQLKFTALEYYLAPRRGSPEVGYWMLFDDDGLVSYGQGGLREAKARAFDTYYTWMAEQGLMKHQAAEQRYAKQLASLYEGTLNPLATRYLKQREEVMAKVDSGAITQSQAQAMIAKKLVEIAGPRRVSAPDAAHLTQRGRYATLAFLGIDLRSSHLINRPRAGQAERQVVCSRLAARLGRPEQCF